MSHSDIDHLDEFHFRSDKYCIYTETRLRFIFHRFLQSAGLFFKQSRNSFETGTACAKDIVVYIFF